MNEIERLKFAVGYQMKKSVFIIERPNWESWVHADGRVTDVQEVSLPMAAAKADAIVVACAASGIVNTSPGIDIVRYDVKDAPCNYNTDHYQVIENLPIHPKFDQIIKTAGVEYTPELAAEFSKNVFVVGPERLGNHWAEEIPSYIAGAEKKDGITGMSGGSEAGR